MICKFLREKWFVIVGNGEGFIERVVAMGLNFPKGI